MLTEKAKRKLDGLISFLKLNKGRIVIDGDTHPTNLQRLEGDILEKYQGTPNYYHGRPISHEELLKEMDASGVDMSLTWQNPAAIQYTNDEQSNFQKLLQANQDIAMYAEKFPQKFIPAGWTDPKALGIDNARKLAEICVREFGFPIVKMNPAQNGYPIDSEEVVIIINHIVKLGATPAIHFGGDTTFTPATGLKQLAFLHPGHPLIAVHMGGGGSHYVDGEELYIQTRELGLQHPNLFFILSAKRDCHIESDLIYYTLAGRPFTDNLACGSDAPYGKVSWNYGGFERMFQSLSRGEAHPDKRLQLNPMLFTQEIIQGYLGRNLAELVIGSCNRVLEVQGAAKIRSSLT